jgi:hypothetical protein
MVDRAAREFFKTLDKKLAKEANQQWNTINKDLKDASEKRNKVAHYSLEYETMTQTSTPDGGMTVEFGLPRLRPSPHNIVSRLLGRTPDKQEHNLSASELSGYLVEFAKLTARIGRLSLLLPLPQPRLGEGLLRAFALDADPQHIASIAKTLPPISGQPSG